MPASRRICGPRLGYRPEMLGATLITPLTPQDTSASALTRSRSTWSMIAISPWFSRLVRNLVRLSILATALTPGLSSEACRPRLNSREARSLDCGRGSVPVPDSLIDSHPARADHLAWVTTEDQACPHHCPASLLLTAVLCLLPLSPGAPRHVPCPVPNPQDRRASGRV